MNEMVKIAGEGPIIMVDDSESDAFLARKCYEKSSIKNEFMWLRSGEELIKYLAEVMAGGNPMPALVLLDINMPELDGMQVLTSIRSTPEFRDIPVITMFTNSNDPRDAQRSKDLGANGFFTKPSNIEEFVALFESMGA